MPRWQLTTSFDVILLNNSARSHDLSSRHYGWEWKAIASVACGLFRMFITDWFLSVLATPTHHHGRSCLRLRVYVCCSTGTALPGTTLPSLNYPSIHSFVGPLIGDLFPIHASPSSSPPILALMHSSTHSHPSFHPPTDILLLISLAI